MAATTNNITLWTSSKVPFEPFDDHLAKDEIKSAMEEIEKHTGIWFAKRGNEPNYIKFEGGVNKSDLGMQGGMQVVKITNDGWWALHEICHAIGLIHEQQRSDSQDSIHTFFRTDQDIIKSCVTIPKNAQGNVDLSNSDMSINCQTRNLTEFDRVSVMLYAKDMGLIKNTDPPSMIWRQDPSLELGASNRKKLSPRDIQGLNILYSGHAGWSPQRKLSNGATKDSPALAVYCGQLYAVWSGYNDDGIFYASFDGHKWSPQRKISNVSTKHSPALAAYNGRLYAVWNGYKNDGIYFASFDGHKWSAQGKIGKVATKDSPALAVYCGRLYAAWNGYNNDGIYYASFDGSKWISQWKIDNVSSKVGPALTVYCGRLYAAWNGYNNDGIFYASYNGNSWTRQCKSAHFGTKISPALGCFHNPSNPAEEDLFLTWKGFGDDGIWWAHFNANTGWSGQARTDFGTQSSPSLAKFQNKLYMAWSGSGNNGIFFSCFYV